MLLVSTRRARRVFTYRIMIGFGAHGHFAIDANARCEHTYANEQQSCNEFWARGRTACARGDCLSPITYVILGESDSCLGELLAQFSGVICYLESL